VHRHNHHRHGAKYDRSSHRFSIERFKERRFARDPLEPAESLSGRHRHPRGGGRHRVFDHGDLRFILLSMIAAKPAHGYDLIKALEERMGGGYSPSPGVIYPTLTMLEEQGYAISRAADGKKLYQATVEGQAFLQANQGLVEAIQLRLDGVARDRNILPDPRIIRAIENLKTALRLRLSVEPIPDDQVRTIAAAIDAAAAAAERSWK
jgi:DNA-binding PadR family transcriptional regulator